MPDALFDPVPISYQGLFADNHLVDAQQFGKSIVGASKIANSICHEFFFGTITHDPRAYQIRFCVGPSKKNGLLQELIAIVTSGMPLYMPILAMVGKEVIQLTIKGVIGGVSLNPVGAMMRAAMDYDRQDNHQAHYGISFPPEPRNLGITKGLITPQISSKPPKWAASSFSRALEMVMGALKRSRPILG